MCFQYQQTSACFNPRPCTRGDRHQLFTQQEGTFQSTPLHEGRPRLIKSGAEVGFVSIHAPARGATGSNLCLTGPRWFQSTPLHEGRPGSRFNEDQHHAFQSTPLHEGRLSIMLTVAARDLRRLIPRNRFSIPAFRIVGSWQSHNYPTKQHPAYIANLPAIPPPLGVRAKESAGLRGHTRAWPRHARSSVSSLLPDSRTASCLSPHPSH